jgi:putative transposase
VLTHHFNWKRLSMAAALAYAPDGSDATLVFSMQPGSYNDESLIVFLSELHDLLEGNKATVI